MATMNYTGTLSVLSCADCGMTFGIPSDFEQHRRADRRRFYCPAGHPLSFGETEAERLKRRLKYSEAALERSNEREERTRRSLAATRGVLTRTKNRIAAGKCPCCRKEFKVLAKHMAKVHPEYTGEVENG